MENQYGIHKVLKKKTDKGTLLHHCNQSSDIRKPNFVKLSV